MGRGRKIQVGGKFGCLEVTKDLGTAERCGVFQRRLECVCDCGNVFVAWAGPLRAGNTKSCGCLRKGRRESRLPLGEAAFRAVFRSYQGNARTHGRPFILDLDETRELFQSPCTYCGFPPQTISKTRAGHGEFVYNGLDRVDNTKGYVPGNVVPCCSRCNIAKQDLSVGEFLDWARRIFEHISAPENVVRIVF